MPGGRPPRGACALQLPCRKQLGVQAASSAVASARGRASTRMCRFPRLTPLCRRVLPPPHPSYTRGNAPTPLPSPPGSCLASSPRWATWTARACAPRWWRRLSPPCGERVGCAGRGAGLLGQGLARAWRMCTPRGRVSRPGGLSALLLAHRRVGCAARWPLLPTFPTPSPVSPPPPTQFLRVPDQAQRGRCARCGRAPRARRRRGPGAAGGQAGRAAGGGGAQQQAASSRTPARRDVVR